MCCTTRSPISRPRDSILSTVQDALVTGLAISGHLERPTDRRADQPLNIVESGDGTYRGVAQGVAPGQWDLVIEAHTDGKRLFLSHNRVILN